MAISINIPKLGMVMSEAQLVEWLAKEGDRVEKGDKVLLIETDKVTWELEAPAAGFLHVLVGKGGNAAVGTAVALLTETREELEALQKEQPRGIEGAIRNAPSLASEAAPAVASSAEEGKPIVASPAARRFAKERGIDLTLVEGTGPSGRITESDVTSYLDKAPSPAKITPLAERIAKDAGLDLSAIVGTGGRGKIVKEDVERALAVTGTEEVAQHVKSIPMTGIRKRIAQNMHSSLQNTAQVTSFTEVDVTDLMKFRDLVREEYKKEEIRISYNDIIILVTANALKRFPIMNSTQVDDKILLHDAVNIGIAVDTADGLVVPVLRDADKKGLLQIAKESRELARKARDGALVLDEITGGTFTISNSIMMEIDCSTPILRPPETGLLGVYRVKEKPVVYKGQIAIRSIMYLSITYDHRVVDGIPANGFLGTIGRYLQDVRLILT